MAPASFEWDENKRLSTLEKHGLDFLDVVDIFDSPVLTVLSKQNSGEDRWLAIGIAQGLELAIVYTIRGNAYRIITARRARKNERREYYACYPERSP